MSVSMIDDSELGPSLVALYPVPDLTGTIIKLNDQYSEGGSFGDVYRCKHHSSSGTQEVAVKAFRFKFTVNEQDGNGSDGRSVKMIRRELGIWRRLDHKNIVPFLGTTYGFGRLGAASLVSLWMPNGTLHDYLAKHGARLTTAHRLQLLLDISNGLCYLHSLPIIHGDLSCNNVLLDASDNARLTDFGYASLVGEIPEALAYLQMSYMRPGTLRWAAPEHFAEDPEEIPQWTTKSDVYSFGNIALEVFSGKQPWSEIRRDVAVILLLAQGKKPGRPQSRPMDDQYWQFIECCWLEVQERPSAEDIVSALRHFRASPPLSQSLSDSLRSSAELTASQPTSSGSSLSFIVTAVDDNTNDVDDTSISHSVPTARYGCSDGPIQDSLLPSQGDAFSGPYLPAASHPSSPPLDAKRISSPVRLEGTLAQQEVVLEPRHIGHYGPDQSFTYLPIIPNAHHGSVVPLESPHLGGQSMQAPLLVPPRQVPSSSTEIQLYTCGWRINDGPTCGEPITSATLPQHFISHRIVSVVPDVCWAPPLASPFLEPSLAEKQLYTCGWHANDGICGGQLTTATLPQHLVSHGIINMGSDLHIVCRWCQKILKRANLVRHVREVHLGTKRHLKM